jgi:ketosteroid isomerase-like protein
MSNEKEQEMDNSEISEALKRHWAGSEAGDDPVEYEIYHPDAELEYPQSGERFDGVDNIRICRTEHPALRHFSVQRILGQGDLWVTEYIITYDGKPVNTVSIMEFREGKVWREIQYFADPFDAPAWRKKYIE